MVSPSPSTIRNLPKVDLHSHIDGSVPLGELFRIARRHGRRVVTSEGTEIDSVPGLVAHIVGQGYGSLLEDIVKRFFPLTNIMQTQEVLRDVGRSYAEGLKRDNVVYAEGRFAPQYHTREGLSIEEVISSMAEGLAEGCETYGVRIGLIVAIGRESTPGLGKDVARSAVQSHMVVGLDLGGPEAGNPPEKFGEAFRIANEAGLNATVHAGEGAGSVEQNLKNIRSAITLLGARRIGHAIDLAKENGLVDLVLERNVAVEMNPISNLTLGKITSVKDLHIDDLLGRSVSVSLNSDDPALWPKGKLSDVFIAVCRAYGFKLDSVDKLVANSVGSSFADQRVKAEILDDYNAFRKTVK